MQVAKTGPKSKEDIAESMNQIEELFSDLSDSNKLKMLSRLGVGSIYYTCQKCGEVKRKSNFYQSTEPGVKTQVTDRCKECITETACPMIDGVRSEPTMETVDNALYEANKPFLDVIWDASIQEARNVGTSINFTNVWQSYIKNISQQHYDGYTYKNSDGYTGGMISLENMLDESKHKEQEIVDNFEQNKSDALRLLGWLPFEKEKIVDQPFLYAQLIGFLDSNPDGNDDMMRVSSIIDIVRGFKQNDVINDQLAAYQSDARNAAKNMGTIKALYQMKAQNTQAILKLAEQNCISLKNSKTSVRGESTWTGKISKIKDLNLRSSQVNGFDIATCKGMQQVQEMSDASIMKQLALDESEWSDMVATMRSDNQKLRTERDCYQEINRILLRENIDLKDYIEELGFDITLNLSNLKDLYSPFSSREEEEENESEDNITE